MSNLYRDGDEDVFHIPHGRAVKTKLKEVRLEALSLDRGNPRLKTIIDNMRITGKLNRVTQQALKEIGENGQQIRQLANSLRVSRRSLDPVFVRSNGQVFDGFRRVLAYSILRNEDDAFAAIPVRVFPPDMTEDEERKTVALLHIGPRIKQWSSFDQARHVLSLLDKGVKPEEIADITRWPAHKVDDYKEACVLMQEYSSRARRKDGSEQGFVRISDWTRFQKLVVFVLGRMRTSFEGTPGELARAEVGIKKWFFKLMDMGMIGDCREVEKIAQLYNDPHLRAVSEKYGTRAAIAQMENQDPRTIGDKFLLRVDGLVAQIDKVLADNAKALLGQTRAARHRRSALMELQSKIAVILEENQ